MYIPLRARSEFEVKREDEAPKIQEISGAPVRITHETFSGASINEIPQMQAEGISKINDVWTMPIAPKADSIKTIKKRVIPLHLEILDH